MCIFVYNLVVMIQRDIDYLGGDSGGYFSGLETKATKTPKEPEENNNSIDILLGFIVLIILLASIILI